MNEQQLTEWLKQAVTRGGVPHKVENFQTNPQGSFSFMEGYVEEQTQEGAIVAIPMLWDVTGLAHMPPVPLKYDLVVKRPVTIPSDAEGTVDGGEGNPNPQG